jgi:hypothetical protein
MGVDGTPSSYNLFAYCGNNPVMGYDPTGRFVITAAIIFTSACIGGAFNFVSSFASEWISGNLDGDSWKKILCSTAIGFFEGGLSAAFPGAGWAISCGAGIVDSVASDLIEGNTNLGQIATNALFSGAMGAVGGSGANDLVKGHDIISDGVHAGRTLLQAGLHPTVKKTLHNTIKTANKYIRKAVRSELVDSFMYDVADNVGRFVIDSVLF